MFFPINKLSSISLVFLVMVLLPGWPLSAAEKAGTSYEATTTADPGISVDALELKLKPLRRDEVKAEAEAMIAAIKAGEYHPFTGPINKQDGTPWLAEGEVATDEQLVTMDFFIEGITGEIPN